jgi:3-isopropylmalate/(R)-2-methylmalate dehydratase small subunit
MNFCFKTLIIFALGKSLPFAIDDYTRWRLMEGLDDIGLTMKQTEAIDSFEKARTSLKPKTLPIKS